MRRWEWINLYFVVVISTSVRIWTGYTTLYYSTERCWSARQHSIKPSHNQKRASAGPYHIYDLADYISNDIYEQLVLDVHIRLIEASPITTPSLQPEIPIFSWVMGKTFTRFIKIPSYLFSKKIISFEPERFSRPWKHIVVLFVHVVKWLERLQLGVRRHA